MTAPRRIITPSAAEVGPDPLRNLYLTLPVEDRFGAVNNCRVVRPGSNGVFMTGHDNGGQRRSADNGMTWSGVTSNNFHQGNHIQDFATDGQGVWVAGCQSGYAGRSTDDGLTWTSLPRGLNCGSNTVWVQRFATDGQGVYVSGHGSGYAARSANNGANWAALPRGLNTGLVTSTNMLGLGYSAFLDRFTAAYDAGYCSYSDDKGQTWTTAQKMNVTVSTVLGMAASSQSAAVVCVSYNQIFVSQDGGETWQEYDTTAVILEAKLNNLNFQDVTYRDGLFLIPCNGLVTTNEIGGFFYSLDEGVTWKVSDLPHLDAAYAVGSNQFARSHPGEVLLFQGTTTHAARSIPKAEVDYSKAEDFLTWHEPQPRFLGSGGYDGYCEDSCITSDGSWLVFYNRGYWVRSTNGGQTWDVMPQWMGGISGYFGYCATGPGGVVIMACTNGAIMRSNDDGATFTKVSDWGNSGGSGTLAVNHCVGNNGVFLIGWANGWECRSVDNGLTWLNVPQNFGLGTAEPQDADVSASGEILVARLWGHIARSGDSGETWQSVNSDDVNHLYDICFGGDDTAITVGDAGRALRSVDRGLTWTPMNAGLSHSQTLNAFESCAYCGDGIYAVFPQWTRRAESGSNHVSTPQISLDNGVNWYGAFGFMGMQSGVITSTHQPDLKTAKYSGGRLLACSGRGRFTHTVPR